MTTKEYNTEWRAKHPNYMRDYAKNHKQQKEKTCACGKKFLGFGNSKYCFECSPYKSRNVQKHKVLCVWCKTQFESNISSAKYCEECRDNKFDYLHKTIFDRIDRLFYGKAQERELARFEKLGCKYRFTGEHAHFNVYYFGNEA